MYCFTAEEIGEGLTVVLGEAPSAAVVDRFVAGCRLPCGAAMSAGQEAFVVSIKSRAQLHGQQLQSRQAQTTTGTPGAGEAVVGTTPIGALAGFPCWGIVDGERVKVLGPVDIPNASLGFVCNDPVTGYTVPVPYPEVQMFPDLTDAALDALISTRRTSGR